MLGWLLNIAYLLLLIGLSPWLVYAAARKGKYRQGWGEKFLGRVPFRAGQRPCIWLHAVSVGEVKLLQPLLAELGRRRPDVQCVISTTTRTGYELAANLYPEQMHFYCPLDFTWAVSAAMRRVRPDLLVLCELELWPNLVRAARRQGARVAVVNGRLSERSFRGYRRIKPLMARLLQSLDLVAVQNREYTERFLALGARPETVVTTGSLKFDGAVADRRNPRTAALRLLTGWPDDAIIFLAGSTQAPEEALAIETFRSLLAQYPRLRLVLVPRHAERFEEVARLLDASSLPWQRRSELSAEQLSAVSSQAPAVSDQHARPTSDLRPPTSSLCHLPSAFCSPTSSILHPPSSILLVDTIGELSAWWGTAAIAFVGGSLGMRGGQNMLEPAAYGAAVSFGPNTWNFRDIVEMLLTRDAAVVVEDGAQLTDFVRHCLTDSAFAANMGRRAAALVAEGRGATARTVDALDNLLSQPASVSRAA